MYLEGSGSPADIRCWSGTRYPAGGLSSAVDTGWHTSQTLGLVGTLYRLTTHKQKFLSFALMLQVSAHTPVDKQPYTGTTTSRTQDAVDQTHRTVWCCKVSLGSSLLHTSFHRFWAED